MIVHQEQSKVFLRVTTEVLTVNHRIAKVLSDLLGKHLNKLTFLFLSLQWEKQLWGILLRNIFWSRQLLHLCLVPTEHLLKHSQMPTIWKALLAIGTDWRCTYFWCWKETRVSKGKLYEVYWSRLLFLTKIICTSFMSFSWYIWKVHLLTTSERVGLLGPAYSLLSCRNSYT